MPICFGVCYAIRRERLRSPEYIHALYQETNRESSGGQLPDVVVKVEDLSEAKAEGETYKESKELFVIVPDLKWNTSEDEALHRMRHESCHVATWGQAPDPHGPLFQERMKLSVGRLVLGGLVASGILFLFGYGVERLILFQKRPFAEVITSEAKPITAMKRKVSGIALIAFGALVALFNQLGAGIFIVVVGRGRGAR